MHVPEPKTNSLIEKLKPSITEGRNLLSELELRRAAKEAGSIRELNQKWCVEGMISFLKGDVEEGIRLFEMSISSSPGESVSWSNYVSALHSWCQFSKAREVFRRGISNRIPVMLEFAFVWGSSWADREIMDSAYPVIEKMDIQRNFHGVHKTLFEAAMSVYSQLKNAGNTISDELSEMSSVVMHIAEEEHLPLVSTRVTHDGSGEYGFAYGVDTTDPHYLVKLDNMLFDRLIAQGIKSKNCIAFFESIAEEE
ncbi:MULTISPECIES: tetratricopeptide repeat protein [Brenneria]|uniref:Tetratricopeptide repeat protein n=1 Tax=Brenneria nigrifluens DSM 30175 = ATCC 13028 TaxID=1121120 RepID=A0A2U1UUV3_9GAMM|nr:MULTISPECIES: hypothetical protein [Brenneria]EHD22071.1 hypothetical protein BrE312_2694 [Brenneria sp. EniD312]MCL2899786.1 hypothetical protein [Brenneria tiliae]MCL2904725.1 hypothetical protein [Brenneria tiliae]PWC25400.1 hypothetical protein DDT54_05760 [Brenneria nigrifluens DSM 30175 = ATCC 13028]QCR05151.1 hypothetical protein EH206_13720 [Brenneria nigrifluens DSM 30175 = ATCC 13028]